MKDDLSIVVLEWMFRMWIFSTKDGKLIGRPGVMATSFHFRYENHTRVFSKAENVWKVRMRPQDRKITNFRPTNEKVSALSIKTTFSTFGSLTYMLQRKDKDHSVKTEFCSCFESVYGLLPSNNVQIVFSNFDAKTEKGLVHFSTT